MWSASGHWHYAVCALRESAVPSEMIWKSCGVYIRTLVHAYPKR